MKVLLITPSRDIQVSAEAKPPLGLAYIAAVLEKDNHEVMIEDMYSFKTSIKELKQKVEQFKPDLVGISVLTYYVGVSNKIAGEIKKILNVPVVVGNSHPSSIPRRTLKEYKNFDIVVIGEGEQTMRELCQAVELNKSISKIKGIAYRKGKEIKVNKPRPLIENLDEIPFPAWHLLKMDEYFKETSRALESEDRKVFSVFTSRGCPGRCTFCAARNMWGIGYRTRSPKNVVDEIEMLYKKYGIRFILFDDDTLTLKREHISQICDGIMARKLNIKWSCYGRMESFKEDVVKKMKKAGCVRIGFGIESGSQKTINLIRKGINLKQVRSVIETVRKYGIYVTAFWMIGFPNETEEDIRRTIEFNKSLPLDEHEKLSVLTPYPGSEIYYTLKKEGLILSEDWDRYGQKNVVYDLPIVKTRYLSNKDLLRLREEGDKELIQLTHKKRIQYYLRHPEKLIRRLIKHPKKILRLPTLARESLIKHIKK